MNFRLVDLPFEITLMEEICDNALDDDGDGLIDINDPDCVCEIIEPISLIPNPSFEDLNCCPDDRSQLNCADVWIQASEPTTDLIHTCDWLGWDEFPPPTPFPDGEGIMGFRDGRVRGNNQAEQNWKEYAGACLLSPLEKDSAYRFEFDVGFVNELRSPPINITFFGTSDCQNLPFGVGNEAFGCPTNGTGWVNLGATRLTGGTGNRWVNASIEVIPEQQIEAIAIGPACPGVHSAVSTYYFFDNLLLANFKSFELKVSTVTHPCNADFALKVSENTDFSYQWYKEGIALAGETFSQLTAIYGEGNYQVIIDDGVSCRLSQSFTHTIPVFSERISRTICEATTYDFGDQQLSESGVYVDTFKTEDNCTNIVTLDLKVLGTLADTVQAKIFAGETYEVAESRFKKVGDYILELTSSQACDSLVLLQLTYYNLYIPNVFSPNFDGINDTFTILSESGLIENIDLSIYNRWGGKIFQGASWDGKYNGQMVNPGVYLYLANIKMDDGKVRQFAGDLSLLK